MSRPPDLDYHDRTIAELRDAAHGIANDLRDTISAGPADADTALDLAHRRETYALALVVAEIADSVRARTSHVTVPRGEAGGEDGHHSPAGDGRVPGPGTPATFSPGDLVALAHSMGVLDTVDVTMSPRIARAYEALRTTHPQRAR